MRGTANIALLFMLATATAGADVLTTTSGRKMSGAVVAEDAHSITFEIRSAGMAMREVFRRSEVASIVKPREITGTSYFEIPIMGMIGREVTATAVGEALDAARRAKATHVVLLFDSGGGLVSECDRIIDVMDHNRDLSTIAYVKNAQSAAAVIAATCRMIIMHPAGQMGAAVPFKITPDGTPKEVDEKFTSAFRARARTAAAIGRHNPDLIMGMIDPKLVLYLSQDENGVSISAERGDVCIKPKEKILTLTAEEARRYGLAKGIARGMSEVAARLQVTEWTSCGREGWEIMRSRGEAERATFAQAVETAQDQKIKEATDRVTGVLEIRLREAQDGLARCIAEETRLDELFKANTKSLSRGSYLYQMHEAQYLAAKEKVQKSRKDWEAAVEASKAALRQMTQ